MFVYLKDANLSDSDETEAEDEGAALIKPTSSTGKKSINWEDGHLMQGCNIYTHNVNLNFNTHDSNFVFKARLVKAMLRNISIAREEKNTMILIKWRGLEMR